MSCVVCSSRAFFFTLLLPQLSGDSAEWHARLVHCAQCTKWEKKALIMICMFRDTEFQSYLSPWVRWKRLKHARICRDWFGRPMGGNDHSTATLIPNPCGGQMNFSIGRRWRKWAGKKPMDFPTLTTTKFKRQFCMRYLFIVWSFNPLTYVKNQFLKGYKYFGFDPETLCHMKAEAENSTISTPLDPSMILSLTPLPPEPVSLIKNNDNTPMPSSQ